MKFNAWSKARIELGIKRLTSRRCPSYYDPDVEYVTPLLPWKFIKEFLYRDEGAYSPDELQRVINGIFRREVGPEEMFYVHVLKGSEK